MLMYGLSCGGCCVWVIVLFAVVCCFGLVFGFGVMLGCLMICLGWSLYRCCLGFELFCDLVVIWFGY